MISDVITEKLIQLNVKAVDWEDAIRKSAEPLVAEEKVTNGYVDKIIEIAKTTGPYIVITKHVALPHAPSEFGAKEVAIGITTLDTPIKFGNEHNDPVKYLFCLSATDSNSHLKSMALLVDLLEDSLFYQVLDTARDPKMVLDYIKNKENV